ncbi:MAG TPA: 1,6-anhydro-N-acetylmuramyl-L-alanine amidase AmpD [Fontimonas sp.]
MIKMTRKSGKGSVPSAASAVDSAGWLRRVRRVESPNCDARPDANDISLLVIHGISLPPGRFGGPWIDALFTNRLDPAAHPYFAGIAELRVSAHVCIDRRGVATQYVGFAQRAWHAGVSSFEGRSRCNDFSIGIELEGTDDRAYTASQYARLARVVAQLMAAYPQITAERIVGHSDIAPGRKTDPGASFDWSAFRRALAAARR